VDRSLVDEAVRTVLEPFLVEHGFRESMADAHSIAYESDATRVTVTWDPRGEIDVTVTPLAASSVHERWAYGEITSPAAVPIHLREVVRTLRGQPGVLAGDDAEFERLRQQNEQRAEAWTAYSSGRGPRPKRTGPLP
jgi:hypothetical protein